VRPDGGDQQRERRGEDHRRVDKATYVVRSPGLPHDSPPRSLIGAPRPDMSES
jgi:hypothetical protein